MEESSFTNTYEKFWVEDEILIGEFFKGLTLDVDGAKICVKDRITFSKGKNYPFLVDTRGLVHITKEARDYLGSTDGSEGVIASAILIGSPVTRIIGNFFMSINKPIIPVRLFNEREDAKKWLSQFIKP
jgi:hypothetical protein